MRPSFHEDYTCRQEIRGGSDRSFGVVMGVFFLLAGMWPVLARHAMRRWAIAAGALVIATAIVHPAFLRPFNRAWTKVGFWIGRVTTPLITGVLFFFAVTPTALLLRLFRRDPLRLHFKPGVETYWIERKPPGPAPETMRNQF